MSKRKLPAADISARPGMRTELVPSALSRWNADVQAKSEEESDNTISVLDIIGEDWWTGGGVTSLRVAARLRAIGKRDVVVNINSPGGDYFEGLAIYNLLREHPAKVTVKVLGIAASAASVIAMAGDEVQVARAGFLMIHNTWVLAAGDRHQLREVADWLEPFDQSAIDIYAARTGIAEKDLGKMLDRETWIGGAEAVEKGFADGLLSSDDIAVKARADSAPGAITERKIDALLAKAGVSRSERRELFAGLKGGTRDAALSGMQDAAAITAEVESLLASIRSI